MFTQFELCPSDNNIVFQMWYHSFVSEFHIEIHFYESKINKLDVVV